MYGNQITNIMNPLEIQRRILIIQASESLLALLKDTEEISFVKNLINSNKNIVDSYNKQNLTITNITPTENGIYKSAIKKVVLGYYFNKLNLDEYEYESNEKLREKFKLRCDFLVLDEDFKSKYILYSRTCNKYYPNSLEKALKQSLHEIIISEFYKQNKKFINQLNTIKL